MLELLKSQASPLDKAKEFVEADNVQSFHELLIQEANNITESTYIRSNSKYNLLHWCVKYKSSKCLRLLIRNFKWDPHHLTQISQDALDLAMTECYLPILYEILRVNEEDWPTRVKRTKQQQPSHFKLINWLLYPSSGTSIELNDMSSFEIESAGLSPSCLYLSAELLMTHSPNRNKNVDHLDSDFLSWFCEKRSNPSLSELCRRVIRLRIVSMSQWLEHSSPIYNYFHLVNKLAYPPMLKDYLCYMELWPVQSRDSFIPYRRLDDYRHHWQRREFAFDVVDL